MTDTEKTLLELEQRMLDADAAYDAAFFEEYCADDFVAVGGYGSWPKKQVVEMYAQGGGVPGRRSEIHDPTVMMLGDGGALINYTLVSTTGEEPTSWYATTAYRLTPAGWRVVVLQQTPISTGQPSAG